MSPLDRKARRAAKPELMPLEGRRLLTVTQSPAALAFAHQNLLRATAANPIAAIAPGGLIGGTPAPGVAAPTGKLASAAANLKAVAALAAQSSAADHALPVTAAAPTTAALSLAKRGIKVPAVAPSTGLGVGNLLATAATDATTQAEAAGAAYSLTSQGGSFAGSATSAGFQAQVGAGRPVNVAAEQAATTYVVPSAANRLG